MWVRSGLFALTLCAAASVSAPALAQADSLQCRTYAAQVNQARDNRERLAELIAHPRAADCPNAANEARRLLRALSPAGDAGEPSAWALAARVNSRAAYQAYLDQHPSGANAAEARRRIRALTPAPTRPEPEPEPTPAPIAAPSREFDDCHGEQWCPRMVRIPAGSLSMGSPADEVGRGADETQRQVSIAAFAASKFEITGQQWQACVSAGGCVAESAGLGQRPVTQISWDDAQQYIAWLSRRTGHVYRLLSEAEWEYAARAGAAGRFSWGDAEPSCEFVAANGALSVNCRAGEPYDVGRYPANAFGLHDMHGNVREFVQDCYAPLANIPADGSANVTNGCDVHRGIRGAGARGVTAVLRGGSYLGAAAALRSAKREGVYRSFRAVDLGFRVARAL